MSNLEKPPLRKTAVDSRPRFGGIARILIWVHRWFGPAQPFRESGKILEFDVQKFSRQHQLRQSLPATPAKSYFRNRDLSRHGRDLTEKAKPKWLLAAHPQFSSG